MKLNFICPGAPKSATTTLYDILRQHSGIILPTLAETNYFAYNHLYHHGLEWYEKEYFPYKKKNAVIGDISTAYMTFAEIACPRLKSSYGPDLKFVFILRNPVDRAYSHYCMRRYNNIAEQEEFSNLVARLTQKKQKYDESVLFYLSQGFSYIEREFLDSWKYLHYFRNGEYGAIVNVFLKYFSFYNMHFVLFEEFVSDPQKHIVEILNFLGLNIHEKIDFGLHSNNSGKIKYPILHKGLKTISTNQFIKNLVTLAFGHSNVTRLYYYLKNKNRTAHKPPELDPATRKALYGFYQQDINCLQQIISKDLNCWQPI